MIWFIISEKGIMRRTFLYRGTRVQEKSQQGIQENCVPEFPILSALKLPTYGLVVFIDMNTYILTEGRSFRTFLEENYAIALNSYFTKKCSIWN